VADDRNIPALGRIGDPDDILASVLVEDGKVLQCDFSAEYRSTMYFGQILPETYQAMPSYRLCTADGLPQLTQGLAQKLKAVLEERAREERDGVVPH
jgi:hypothetical protein